jgi:hypothetical protein
LKLNFLNAINKIGQSEYKALALCLTIGFAIRLIPELLAYPNPIGFDTIGYALIMKNGVIISDWSQFFASTWLLYAIIVPLYNLFQGNPFLILKIIGPLLFGLNVAGVYFFARKMLGWSFKMSLIAGIFFALQLASLRISWDLLRNTLGLGILLFAFAYIKDVGSKRGLALFTGLSLLAVFAHEYAAVILFGSVFGLLGWKLVKRQSAYSFKWLAIGIIPALSVFMVGLYLRFNPIYFGGAASNVLRVNDSITGSQGFYFVNYLQIQNTIDSYSSYWALVLQVGLLFAVLFLPYIILVKKGFFRNSILNIWTLLALVGAFGCLILPFFALELWYRWMFLLVYPFTFYAVYGLAKILRKSSLNLKSIFSLPISHKKAKAMILITLTLGVAYLVTPITLTYANKSVPNITHTEVYFSTDPAIPYQDVKSLTQAINWLNNNLDSSSCVILQNHFSTWGQMYLDKSHTIVNYNSNINYAIGKAYESGFSNVFFVWWNQPVGWNEGSVTSNFTAVQSFDRISVYRYQSV